MDYGHHHLVSHHRFPPILDTPAFRHGEEELAGRSQSLLPVLYICARMCLLEPASVKALL